MCDTRLDTFALQDFLAHRTKLNGIAGQIYAGVRYGTFVSFYIL